MTLAQTFEEVCCRNNQNPPIWKGRDYNHGGIFGSRILIVGESTYSTNGSDTSQYNVLMAQDHINGYRDAFRTKLLRAFLNMDNEQKNDIDKFWHSVCYLNYITVPLSRSRKSPSEKMWVENCQPLSSLLTELKPHLVVALGYRMWANWTDNPPCQMRTGPEIDGAGQSNTYYFVSSENGHNSLAYCLKHPSSGFSWQKEHPFLMKAIKISKEERQPV